MCFRDIDHASLGIERTHTTSEMVASYAKFGVSCSTTPSIAVAPNPILYISVFPYFTEPELTRIFRGYEGFDSVRFFSGHCLVRFSAIELARKALEDLNSSTNLFANYSTKGAKGGGRFSTMSNGSSSHNNSSNSLNDNIGNSNSQQNQHQMTPRPPSGMSIQNNQTPPVIPVSNAWLTTPTSSLLSSSTQSIIPSASSLTMDSASTSRTDIHNGDIIPIQQAVMNGLQVIHVSNITLSKAGLRKLFGGFEGFRKLAFHTGNLYPIIANLCEN